MPIEPNTKASIFNGTSVAANTRVLSANVTPSETPTLFEIQTAIDTPAAISLTDWDNSTSTEESYTLNTSTVGADELQRYTAAVNESREYNVEFDQQVTVNLLQIDERDYYHG